MLSCESAAPDVVLYQDEYYLFAPDPVEGAQGYFIRRGIDPHNLHTHWQVIGDTEATVYCLTKGVTYYVTVDACNESGIAYGSDIQKKGE